MSGPGIDQHAGSHTRDSVGNGPYDVGHTTQHNIVVEIEDPHQPEWRHQYRIKKDVEEGIKTITGLLNASVLEKTTSEWNTRSYQ